MTKIPLFVNKKEIFYAFLAVVILYILSISYEFYRYEKLKTYSLHVSEVKVIKHYTKINKKSKKYEVLKLKSDDFSFYTINKYLKDVSTGDILKVVFYTRAISFVDYLKGFYANSKLIRLVEKNKTSFIKTYVKNQHIEPIIQELYSALFFATTISKDLRADITQWGIAHLIAISGFHLGILSAILYFIFKPFYILTQDRFFPYRNQNADLAVLVFAVLGLYVYFIDFTPSILRAYVMSLVGFFFFSKGLKILSFVTLFFTVCLILIFFPKLMFSIAFWLSVCGVFYVFLFLHYFSKLNKLYIFVLLNFWVFILMLPISHFLFYTFSLAHLLVPIISMIFIVFYPLTLLLHVVGFGGLLDNYLIWFLSLHVETFSLVTPFWLLGSYVSFSILAIRFKFFVYLLFACSFYLFSLINELPSM